MNQEILEKAIKKAIDGGWKYPFSANCYEFVQVIKSRPFWIAFGIREDWQDEGQHLEGSWSIPELIFNHDFAKALWGEEYVYRADCIESPEEGGAGYQEDYAAWEFHLREMVIADNPIEYLGENI